MANTQLEIKEDVQGGNQNISDDVNELSIPEVANRVESRSIEPKALDKEILRKCAVHYRSRGYSTDNIAEIIGVSNRTIERYCEDVRTKNSLNIGTSFQRQFLGETLNNIGVRYQRLLRQSYSDKISERDRARIIFMCHRIEMDGVMLLTRVGYLSREVGEGEIRKVQYDAYNAVKEFDEQIKKKLAALSPEQKDAVAKCYNRHQKEDFDDTTKMIDDFTQENIKQKSADMESKS